jgi:hypothetical protein
MFPNIRVMIAALLATVFGIGCGLGALAVFRVDHQPFTRLQSANPPLQLAFGGGLPATVMDGTPAPFGVRFQMNAPRPVQETMSVPLTAMLATAGAGSNSESNLQTRLEGEQQPNPTTQHEGTGDIVPVSAMDNEPTTVEASSAAPAAEIKNTAAVETNPAVAALSDNDAAAKPDPSPTIAATTAERPAERELRRRIAKVHRPHQPQAAIAARVADRSFATPVSQSGWQGSAQDSPQLAGPTPLPFKHVIAKRHRSLKQAPSHAANAEQAVPGASAIATSRR